MIYLAGAVSLLKLCLGCTVGGLAVTMVRDEDIKNLFRRLKVKVIKKVKKFNIGNEHATILGLTQHGKTYGIIKTLDNMKEPILFFNTNHTPLKGTKSKWYDATGAHDINQIIYALNEGYKINFLPSDDVEGMEKQLSAITNEIYKQRRGFTFRYVIDEVHLFTKEGKKALIRLASTGLGRG